MVNKSRRVVLEKPSGNKGVGRGQHANEGILGGALSQFGVPAPGNGKAAEIGKVNLSALRVEMMESISLAVSSNLVKRALSLMLALVHLSISVLVAFVGALSSNTGRWAPTI